MNSIRQRTILQSTENITGNLSEKSALKNLPFHLIEKYINISLLRSNSCCGYDHSLVSTKKGPAPIGASPICYKRLLIDCYSVSSCSIAISGSAETSEIDSDSGFLVLTPGLTRIST